MRRALVLVALLAACRGDPAPRAIEIHGSLRGMMHEGKTGGVVRIADVAADGVYGLGALGDLAGEVTIVAGRVTLSYPDGRVLEGAGDTEAALLVALAPRSWTTIQLDGPVDSLEAALPKLATERQLTPPFLFVIEGQAQVRYHVVDGSKLVPGSSHAEHRALSMNAAHEGQVTIVGFYSTAHEGVFTHMGERVHAHLVAPGAAGHVDELHLQPGATVRIGR